MSFFGHVAPEPQHEFANLTHLGIVSARSKSQSPLPFNMTPKGRDMFKNPTFRELSRIIRTDRDKNTRKMTARVDLGKSQRQIPSFSAGMVIPDENMHFHDPEPLKN